ncbi:MAG: hypothetical protein ABIS07_05155 [Dokdonella sp.]
MTKLELVASTTGSISTAQSNNAPSLKSMRGVHLRCPTCACEIENALTRAFDVVVKCPSCNSSAEFRQWHEAWCASRREILVRMFPQLKWLKSGYSEIVPSGGSTHEHLREMNP